MLARSHGASVAVVSPRWLFLAKGNGQRTLNIYNSGLLCVFENNTI